MGAGPPASAVEPVRWGILSAARIGELAISACAGSAHARFVAVASRDLNRADEYARRFSLERAYGAYEELIAADEIDAVYVACPNSLHAVWARRAAEAGKHVLVEKPFARDPSAAQAAIRAAARSGTLLAEAFQWRYHPQTDLVRRLVAEGAVGHLRHIRAELRFRMAHPLDSDIRGSAALEGGCLMDLGSYCVAAARMFLGEPESVSGVAELAGAVDVRFAGLMRFAGSATASFDTAMNLPRRDGLELIGSEGVAWVPDPWHCRDPKVELRAGGPTETIRPQPDGLRGDLLDAYRCEFETLSQAIRGGRPLDFAPADIVAQAQALAALHAAAAG